MSEFKLVSPFKPMGDQVQAIQELVECLKAGKKEQASLGGTGTGKTFTDCQCQLKNIINQLWYLLTIRH